MLVGVVARKRRGSLGHRHALRPAVAHLSALPRRTCVRRRGERQVLPSPPSRLLGRSRAQHRTPLVECAAVCARA
eukprot:scaffold3108_cov175-Prasinococcus_capsulatus_cf.AAC.1